MKNVQSIYYHSWDPAVKNINKRFTHSFILGSGSMTCEGSKWRHGDWRAIDAHNGGVEAQNEASEGL
jgi:hypothetical protein